jgi:hypothetical protein
VCLSALERETTRGLLVRIAESLASRWDESAKGPALVPPEASTHDLGAEPTEVDEHELSTVEDMLRAAKKRIKKTPVS